MSRSRLVSPWLLGAFLSLTALLLCGSRVSAQEAEETEAKPELQLPNVWVGGTPISLQALHGKAVFLYFFEETCPSCKKKWPEIMEMAKKYEDQPILFVGVNSGRSKAEVEQYVRSVQLNWPVIVDADRSLEQVCEMNEISLQNIMQVRYISADGEMHSGSWNNMAGTVERALKGAKWNIDPAEIPEKLRPTWRSIEFSQYAKTGTVLKKAVASDDPQTKAAAQRLLDVVGQRIQEEMDAARAEGEKNKWEAFKRYTAITQQYAGYPAATEAAKIRRDLIKDEAVRKEQSALKNLERLVQLANSPKPVVRDKALENIKKLIDEQPDSEAAKVARGLLEQQ